ncbi:hypothetical protein [Salipaludibacillus aurantiacus]|nr:hypothetical protein [Salipaludibacillus aurantiacus]
MKTIRLWDSGWFFRSDSHWGRAMLHGSVAFRLPINFQISLVVAMN